MKVIDPGHFYQLNWLDEEPVNIMEDKLVFVKREGEGYPGNVGHHGGTTIQEVLRALIDRMKYLDNQIQDQRNTWVINYLRQAIHTLESRAAERHGRKLNFRLKEIETIELLPVCPKCMHIGCSGSCH